MSIRCGYLEPAARLLLLFALLLAPTQAFAREINGFILDDGLIPAAQIFSGGPDKDGIPAIDQPRFIKAGDASYLSDEDRVLGISLHGESRAYPIRILNWHEIVNDSIGETAFTITYCPLCGSGVAFNSRLDDRILHFAVSGLLYNSDVLLYDRETESLWSQLLAKAVTGEYKGSVLTMIPMLHTRWREWKRLYPDSQVLSNKTGFRRNYNRDPYAAYKNSQRLFFPVLNKAPKHYQPKENVLGLSVGNSYRAYPFIELNKNNQPVFSDRVNNKQITVHWNKQARAGYITDSDGIMLPVVQAYWFAWYAFHPQTTVFSAAKKKTEQ